MRKVYQYSLEGKYLEEFDSTSKASGRFAAGEHYLRKKLKKEDPLQLGGYFWSRIKKDNVFNIAPVIKKEYLSEKYKNHLLFKEKNRSKAKILIFDIETSPMMVYSWRLYKYTASIEQIALDWRILTWSAKWLGEDEIKYDAIINYHDINSPYDLDDFEVSESLWQLLNKADLVCAHNGHAFDTKAITAKFLEHGLPIPTPYKTVDTLEIAKRNFRLTSNKLDYIAELLGIGKKMEHEGFPLWEKCMHGDKKAFKTMIDYNKKDVELLEKVYLRLRGYDSRHPSVSIYDPDPSMKCIRCGSDNIKYVKDTYTNTRVYKLYQCQDCNSFSRGRTGKNKKDALMIQ